MACPAIVDFIVSVPRKAVTVNVNGTEEAVLTKVMNVKQSTNCIGSTTSIDPEKSKSDR